PQEQRRYFDAALCLNPPAPIERMPGLRRRPAVFAAQIVVVRGQGVRRVCVCVRAPQRVGGPQGYVLSSSINSPEQQLTRIEAAARLVLEIICRSSEGSNSALLRSSVKDLWRINIPRPQQMDASKPRYSCCNSETGP